MSLILDQCQSTWASLSSSPACEDGTPTTECDAHLARVALAPILIDTTNLTSKDKTTDQDVRAAELAESKLQSSPQPTTTATTTTTNPNPNPAPYDRTTYHNTLATLKEQILHLSYRDILRKDYKRWSEGALALGMSTVVQGLAYTFTEVGAQSRDAFLAALRGWAAEQRLDVAAVMTVSKPGGVFTRELLVWGVSEEGGKVVRDFGRRFGERLGLEAWGGGELDGVGGVEGEGECRVCWRQGGVEYSRKQVAPMLREAMRESSRL
jgi:exopolyphosphatase